MLPSGGLAAHTTPLIVLSNSNYKKDLLLPGSEWPWMLAGGLTAYPKHKVIASCQSPGRPAGEEPLMSPEKLSSLLRIPRSLIWLRALPFSKEG